MANDLIPYQLLTLVTIVGGLICIYLANIPLLTNIMSMIAVFLFIVLGTNNLRLVGKYSLGTGIPSIIYMLTAGGLICLITGLIITSYLNQQLLLPLISLLIAVIFGIIVSLICKTVFKLEIEILTKAFVSIIIASMFTILSMSIFGSSSTNSTIIYDSVVKNALILLLMIITVMAIQNPYNACMGSNEDQYRTLTLALSNASLMLIVISIINMLYNEYWYIYLILSIISWLLSFRKYIKYSKQQAASVRYHGLWPKGDDDIE